MGAVGRLYYDKLFSVLYQKQGNTNRNNVAILCAEKVMKQIVYYDQDKCIHAWMDKNVKIYLRHPAIVGVEKPTRIVCDMCEAKYTPRDHRYLYTIWITHTADDADLSTHAYVCITMGNTYDISFFVV